MESLVPWLLTCNWFVLCSKLVQNQRNRDDMKEFYEENPSDTKGAEIVVGILPWNEAKSINLSTEKIDEGLFEFFPDRRSVIINCDNHSDRSKPESFLEVETKAPKIHLSTPEGVQGKINNLRNLFRKAVELDAKAILVVSANPLSITPRWIKNLGDPLFRNFGFVSPLYLRHRFEGALTSNVVYPLIRALYGRRVRQPIEGDFSFSGELARLYAEDKFWDHRISEFGIEIWMITLAITQGVPICQAFMGQPKVKEPKDPAADLGPMWNQAVGTIFTMMCQHPERWRTVKWSKPTAILGFGQGEMEMIPEIGANKKRLYNRFAEGMKKESAQWKAVLTSEVFAKVTEVADMDADRFDFPTELWAKALFDYAIAFRRQDARAETPLHSLQPLYYGRVLSYINKVRAMSTQQAEQYVEDQCLIFEETKPYLIERWDEA